jgi:hypothetical protein
MTTYTYLNDINTTDCLTKLVGNKDTVKMCQRMINKHSNEELCKYHIASKCTKDFCGCIHVCKNFFETGYCDDHKKCDYSHNLDLKDEYDIIKTTKTFGTGEQIKSRKSKLYKSTTKNVTIISIIKAKLKNIKMIFFD